MPAPNVPTYVRAIINRESFSLAAAVASGRSYRQVEQIPAPVCPVCGGSECRCYSEPRDPPPPPLECEPRPTLMF